jgi:hypothetical protein
MANDESEEALLEKNPEEAKREAARIYSTFIRMAVCFALTMAAVTTVIAFAGADFGAIGNESTGVLFGAYCISALFFGNIIVGLLGLKMSLICGVMQYVIYLSMYLLAYFLEDHKSLANSLVLMGAGIGGVASGYLWTAQGAYFQQCAKKYAKLTGATAEDVTGEFAAKFATIFLFCEVSFKFIGGAIAGSCPPYAMYLVFTLVGVLSAMGMTTIQSVSAEKTEPLSLESVMKKSGLALGLIASDPKMLFLLPTEIAFGFASAFLNSYISPKVIKPIVGKATIGYFAGIVAGVACIVSAGGGAVVKKTGLKWPNMLVGGFCFVCMSGIFLVTKSDEWNKSQVPILALIYALQGVGRGIFESTNKAVVADFFGDRAPAAFANVIWSSGGASAVGYFWFTSMVKDVPNCGSAGHEKCCSGTHFNLDPNSQGHPLCKGVKEQAGICCFSAIAGIVFFFVALGYQKANSSRADSASGPELVA